MATRNFEDNNTPQLLFVETASASVPTPAAGKQNLFVDTADSHLKRKDSSAAVTDLEAGGSGTVTHIGGALTSGKTIVGAGTDDVAVSTLTAQFVGSSSGTEAAASMSTARLLGRTTASSGAVEEITVGAGLSLSAGSLTASGGTGAVVQVVNTEVTSASNGTTQIPYDNTKPQNTEGDEYMTLAITPTNSSHKLRIDLVVVWTNSAAVVETIALFQDSTADALAAAADFSNTGTGGCTTNLTHYMTAGTTSSTTFKVRVGGNVSGTTYFNSHASFSSGIFNGICASSITITEIIP